MTQATEHNNLLSRLDGAIDSVTLNQVRHTLNNLSPPDIAHQLETAPPKFRRILWELVDPEISGEVLQELSDEIQLEFLDEMDSAEVASLTEGLDVDDIVDILQQLPDRVIPEVLQAMSIQDRQRVESVLTYDEDTAGGLMDTKVITVRPDITVDVVLRYLRRFEEIPQITDNLFVVNRDDTFVGNLPIGLLLTSAPTTRVREVMNTEVRAIPVDLIDTKVSQLFKRHDLVSAPVIDDQKRLVGRITIDDVVDVIREESESTVLNMAGLTDEEDIFAPILPSTRRRAIWLGINLITALIASGVISLFQDTIEKVVALAVLMPIVASMGGIAGSQTLTLVIRGIALGNISSTNSKSLLIKEISVGLLNSFLWASVIGIVSSYWFNNYLIGVVIGIAMIANLVFAALSGVLIPILLKKIGVDPALGGSVILTTITDVIGFFSFLALGTIFLL